MAKGLAAGYQPIGAMLCADRITDRIRRGSGFFQHGHTFMGHATAVAAALATLTAIEDESLLANVRKQGRLLIKRLQDELAGHPNVGDIRGRGLFIGVEFVADKASKQSFDPARKTHNRVQKAAMARGLMVYGMGGTIDGLEGDHVLLAPPYIFTDSHVEELVEKLVDAIVESCPVA